MKKFLYLVLIYLMIFRQYQKNKENLPVFMKEQYQVKVPSQDTVNVLMNAGRMDKNSGGDSLFYMQVPAKEQDIYWSPAFLDLRK